MVLSARIMSDSKRRLEGILVAMVAFMLSALVSGSVFEGGRITGDEGSYLFQANAFAEGKWRWDAGPYGDLMGHDMIVLDEKAGWLSRYPPGHSVWLVPGVWVGWPQGMAAVAAGLTALACYELGLRLRLPRFLLPALLLMSPFFVLLHGTLLSHTSGMAASAWMLVFYVRWRQEGGGWNAMVSGLCWSFLLLNRTWTAALIAVPFGVDALAELRRDWKRIAVWGGTLLFVAGALCGVLLYLRYNQLTTGHSRLPTYLLYEASEGLGFGPRRTQGGELYAVNHTLLRGLGFCWENLRNLDRWLLGTPACTLLVWLGLAGHGWNRRWSGMLLGVVLMVPLGYVGFWYPGIPQVGPLYLAETLPYWLLLGGVGVSRIWRRMEGGGQRRRLLFAMAAVGVLVYSVRFTKDCAQAIQEEYRVRWELDRRLQGLPKPALVLLRPLGGDDPMVERYLYLNERGLESDVLRLQVGKEDLVSLAGCFPERGGSVWVVGPRGGGVEIERLEPAELRLSREAANSHLTRGAAENVEGGRRSDAGRHVAGFLFWGWYPLLPAGEYSVTFDAEWENLSPEAPLRLEVMADNGEATLAEKEVVTTLDDPELRFRKEVPGRVEPRVHFGGAGTVWLRRVEIRRLEKP